MVLQSGRDDMEIKTEKKDTHDLFTTPLLQQTAYWSGVKKELGFSPMAFNIKVKEKELRRGTVSSSYILDDVLILSRKISNDQSIAYAPYGPLMTPSDDLKGDFLENLSEELREKLPQDCILIRYDLPWFMNEEEEVREDLREIRINWGTVNHNIRASRSNQLPTHTTLVDLKGTEEEIFSRMKRKTRYNIHLAERKGVKVRKGTIEDLPIFTSLYSETALRNNITEHGVENFEALFGQREDDAIVILLIAEWEGIPLSAMFLTVSDTRASYLYGASSSLHREVMSTYALQAEAIKLAKELGATEYDFFGIAPPDEDNHPLSGLSRFKLGFGGSRIERMGCWDYPLKAEAELFFAQEASWQGYHL